MEEEQIVTFQSVCLEGHVPLFVRLFLIYLLLVLLTMVFRAARLMWALRNHRKAQERELPRELSSQSLRQNCGAEIRWIRNFSHLTFLLAVLVLSWNATSIMAGFAMEKVAFVPYAAARLADALVPFVAGILVSSVLFSCAMFLEGLVRRQRLVLD